MKHILFEENVLAHMVRSDKFDDDFLVYFITKGFPIEYCSLELAEECR